MAVLNIKNLPEHLHAKLQEATHLLDAPLDAPERLSILELRGLGKELWTDVDPVTHVQRERAAWD